MAEDTNSDSIVKVHTAVIGSGPAGYAAAFRLADILGKNKTIALIERQKGENNQAVLGGVCLNEGCIPSKTFLHIAEWINEGRELNGHGIEMDSLTVSKDSLLVHKNKVVKQLNQGIAMLAKKRQVKVLCGDAKFQDAHTLQVGSTQVVFDHAVIATGSRPICLPFLPDDPRVLDSTTALELPSIEGKMLVIGGGIIGCEMATFYQAFGMQVTIVEMLDQIMAGADADLVKPCQQMMEKRGVAIKLGAKVVKVTATDDGLVADLVLADGSSVQETFALVLQSVGRRPNTQGFGLEELNIALTSEGYIQIDEGYRTSHSHIYAIGDVAGNPMLAHKGTVEGRLVAEIISGKRLKMDAKIPSVAYTDPEVAWVGYTEEQAKRDAVAYKKAVFPWMACGRSLCLGRTEGLTKLLVDPKTNRIIGAGIVGTSAGDLLSELTLAIEMGCDVEDIALTIHPHPTLSETVGLAAEVYEGTVTDL